MSVTVVALLGISVLAVAIIACHVTVAATYWWQMRDLRRCSAARHSVDVARTVSHSGMA